MKIRNGFVSNSSSSSFVLLGLKMNYDQILQIFDADSDTIDGILEEYSLVRYGEEDLIGYSIADVDDCNYMTETNTSLLQLDSMAQSLSELLKVPVESISLLTGQAAT